MRSVNHSPLFQLSGLYTSNAKRPESVITWENGKQFPISKLLMLLPQLDSKHSAMRARNSCYCNNEASFVYHKSSVPRALRTVFYFHRNDLLAVWESHRKVQSGNCNQYCYSHKDLALGAMIFVNLFSETLKNLVIWNN